MSTKDVAGRAAREATAAANRRACSIIDLCAKYSQPQAAAGLIGSGKGVDEIEAELKRGATAAGWARAIAKANRQ